MMQSYIDPETGKVVIGVPPPGVKGISAGGVMPPRPVQSMFGPPPGAAPAPAAVPMAGGPVAADFKPAEETTLPEIGVSASAPDAGSTRMLQSRIDPRTRQFVMSQGPGAAPGAAPAPMPAPAPAPVSNAGGGMMRRPLGEYYASLEQERGLPTGYLGKIRAIESANGTNLVNPRSSARGDFQFLRKTAQQYGINPMDPYQSARAAADMAASNAAGLRKRGIDPNGANLYGTHQQGLSGFLKLHSGQRSGNAEMALNGGAGLSPSSFLAKWRSKYDAAQPKNLGEGFVPQVAASEGANRGQGPTVANARAMGEGLSPTAALAQGPAMEAASQAQATAAAPTPADNTYKGGLLGLAGIGDPNAAGMDKGFLGKMGDMAAAPGGGAFGNMAKGLGMLAGGGQSTANRPGITIAPPADNSHKPDAALMAFLDPRRRRQQQLGLV